MKQTAFTLLLLGITLVFSGCTAPETAPTIAASPTAAQAATAVVNDLAATSPPPLPPVSLEDFGIAPELNNETWLNTPAPLRLADLRGQVVLLEMWTFG
jgi:hypothetical protein